MPCEVSNCQCLAKGSCFQERSRCVNFRASMPKLKIIILIACLTKSTYSEVIVITNSGPIQSTAGLSDNVEAFLGVPYAEPPVGDLRFAKPVPKQPWTEIYDASSLPPPCLQYSPSFNYYFLPDVKNMSEDCLYLNIWTPKGKPEEYLKPVIIYIHHGTFLCGSSSQKEFDGSHLAGQGDTVVVTINFRMGPLGFFLAQVEEADGNMGMYDQVMAIQWVKDNAIFFGGDPENIVLMGTSTGAVSVSAHIISPLSQNLIKRAIVQSGSLLNILYSDGTDRLLKNSEHVASIAGCTNETVSLKSDPHAVVECLKRRPKEVLVEAENILVKSNPNPFFPRIGDLFLPDDAATVYREGRFRKDVDVILSTTEDEGCFFAIIAAPDYLGQYGTVPITVSKSRAVSWIRVAAKIGGIKNASEVISFYLKRVKNRTSDGYKKMFADALGDAGVSCSTLFLADFLSLKGNRVYFYKLGFRAASTPMADWIGATHLDDIQYIFANPYHENFTAEEAKLSKRFIARLSAFAKTGNPNLPGELPWLQYHYQDPLYLHIGQEEDSIRMTPLDRCGIWRNVYKSEINSDVIRVLQNSGFSSSGAAKSSRTDLPICLIACLCLLLYYGLGNPSKHHS